MTRQQAVSPTESGKPVELHYVLDGHRLMFPVLANGKRSLRRRVVAVAWDERGNNAGQAWQTIDLELTPESAAELLRDGVRSHRTLTLKPGAYKVRIGAVDMSSMKLGTVEIPLQIVKD